MLKLRGSVSGVLNTLHAIDIETLYCFRMTGYRNHVRLVDLALLTRALAKFRHEHGYPTDGLTQVDACAAALEADDFEQAFKHFCTIPFGGMGTFNDWIPNVAYPHEDANYVWAVDVALSERWYRLMKAAAGGNGKKGRSLLSNE